MASTRERRAGNDRANLYDEITNRIIAELEAGRVPWVQPWGAAHAKAALAMPSNAATRRQYSGINILILWGAVIEHGYPTQHWLTFRQALSLGGNVRKGEHGTTVVYAEPSQPEDDDDEGEAVKPLPERLVMELTAHRTLALRDALAANPHVAVTALLHKLVRDTFSQVRAEGAVIEANVQRVHFREQGKDLPDTPYAQALTERHKNWKADIPSDDEALWGWIEGLDDASRHALLAHCVSFGVNALYERPNQFGASGITQRGLDRRMAEAERLAHVTGLDMVEAGFRPTVENYLGRVTKLHILEAVREGVGDQAAQLIDHLKKPDMAREAERLLADSGWLPEPLRSLGAEPESTDEADAAALPAYLSGGDEADADASADFEDEATPPVAAE